MNTTSMNTASMNTTSMTTPSVTTPCPTSSTVAFRWAMLLWLVILTSLASFRHRHASELWESSGIDAQVKFQIGVWFGLGLVALGLVLRGRADLGLLRRGPLAWMALYAGWALASTAFSVSPLLTAYRSTQFVIAVVLVTCLRETRYRLGAFLVAYLAINWVLVLLPLLGLDGGVRWIRGPDDSFVYWSGTPTEPWRFATGFGHPSIISMLGAVGAIWTFGQMEWSSWRRHALWVVWFMLTVLLTVSRTGIAGMIAGLVIVAFGRRLWIPVLVGSGVLISLALLTPGLQPRAVRFLSRGQDAQQLKSLTGRNLIYEQALDRIEAGWPLGLGFQAARKVILDEEGLGGITHTHNAFLESLASMGAIGGLTAVGIVASLAQLAYRLLRRAPFGGWSQAPAGWTFLGMLAPLIAGCLMDRGFATTVDPYLLTFMAVAAWAQYEWVGGLSRSTERPSQRAWPAYSFLASEVKACRGSQC